MKNQAAYNQIAAYDKYQDQINNKNEQSQVRQTLDISCLSQEILQKIKTVNTSSLRIQDDQRPFIIKQICHINFMNLTNLNLRGNSIVSVQCIQFLICPKLVLLQLYKNKIVTMKSFIKNQNLKFLKNITLYQNPISIWWPVERQYMPQLTQFQLDLNQSTRCTIQDLSKLVKTMGKRTSKLYAEFNQRINQTKIRKILEINNKSYANIKN